MNIRRCLGLLDLCYGTQEICGMATRQSPQMQFKTAFKHQVFILDIVGHHDTPGSLIISICSNIIFLYSHAGV